MTTELLIIDLLSAKKQIIQQYKNRGKRFFWQIILIFSLLLLFFFGISTLVFQHFQTLLPGGGFYYYRLKSLYHFSLFAGLTAILLFLVWLAVFSFKQYSLIQHFTPWIEKQVRTILDRSVVSQNSAFYYLIQKDNNAGTRISVRKETCQELVDTFDNKKIMIGQTTSVLGLYQVIIFILDEKLTVHPNTTKSKLSWNKKIIIALISAAVLGFSGSCYYMIRPYSFTEADVLLLNSQKEATQDSSALIQKSVEGFVEQTGMPPTHQIEKTNDLYLNVETNELYLTTDSGESWAFVPIKADWLRFGDYTLTTGTIPLGYWMDKSFDISSEFSWFIFSEDDAVTSFLFSTDGGKTWDKTMIDKQQGVVRYRKAAFWKDHKTGIAVFSSPDSMSSENIFIYTTNDQGKTWQHNATTSISQPVQNISFISSSTGFIATRSSLYYTHNYGRSFKEALITVPDEYSMEGIDVFQSPNEVTEVSTNTLEAKFNLVKADNIDIGKMFSCLFRSGDNGETWVFEKQLSQIEYND